ncbi:hypothetical protein FHG87_002050 [Trinorchestia longiramus]|nr:hypothetical protein FHG87_002050 [Trinorchestia longiramus]
MEKIQRKATKMIPELRNLSYERRLQRLELVSLEQRRLRGQLIETFKYLNGLNNVTLEGLFERDGNGSPWSLQQDSAPSHGSNVTQTWIQRNISSSISKDVSPARSPDLHSLDFSTWYILETSVFATSHTSLESLKLKLQREWEAIP